MGKRNFTLNYTEEELQAWQEYLLQCINSRVSDRVSDTALDKIKSKNELELSKDLAKQLNLCFEDRNTRKVRKNGTKRKKAAQNRYGCRKKKLNNTQTSQ